MCIRLKTSKLLHLIYTTTFRRVRQFVNYSNLTSALLTHSYQATTPATSTNPAPTTIKEKRINCTSPPRTYCPWQGTWILKFTVYESTTFLCSLLQSHYVLELGPLFFPLALETASLYHHCILRICNKPLSCDKSTIS